MEERPLLASPAAQVADRQMGEMAETLHRGKVTKEEKEACLAVSSMAVAVVAPLNLAATRRLPGQHIVPAAVAGDSTRIFREVTSIRPVGVAVALTRPLASLTAPVAAATAAAVMAAQARMRPRRDKPISAAVAAAAILTPWAATEAAAS